MDAGNVIAELQELADEGTARVYSRRQPEGHVLGVKFGDMGKIVKRIKTDSTLARNLWAVSDAFEARHIACAIMDPTVITEAEIDAWVRDIDFPLLSDDLAALVHKTPWAEKKRVAWTADDREYVRRAGYCLVHLALKSPGNAIPDDELRGYLGAIQDTIHTSPNWSREMMNFVPVAIGQARPHLFDEALATARAYGKIDVFHGDNTNCKITDAVQELTSPRQRPARTKRAMPGRDRAPEQT